jgi:hypothetical protein
VQRQANAKRLYTFGKRARSNKVTFSDEQHCLDLKYSGAKRSRKELQPNVSVLAEDSEHALVSMMGHPSALEDSPASIHHPNSSSPLHAKDNMHVLLHSVVNS